MGGQFLRLSRTSIKLDLSVDSEVGPLGLKRVGRDVRFRH